MVAEQRRMHHGIKIISVDCFLALLSSVGKFTFFIGFLDK